MAFARGSRSGLSLKAESTFGTTPSGNFRELPYNTHSLNVTKERVQSNEIRPDRMLAVDRHGNTQVGGDIVVDLRADVYDELLESAMFNTWDASPAGPDELKVGTTLKSFSFEDALNDISQYRVFTGVTVSQASFSIQPNQMVTTTFTMVGKGGSISSSAKTVDAASIIPPFDAYSGDLQIADTGSTLSSLAVIAGIEFSINNDIEASFVIGSDETPQLIEKMATVEGTLTVYVENADFVNRFLDETETALKVTVNDPTGANEYGFLFPRAKINGAEVPVDGPDARIINVPFSALYDSTEGSNLVITRPNTA